MALEGAPWRVQDRKREGEGEGGGLEGRRGADGHVAGGQKLELER